MNDEAPWTPHVALSGLRMSIWGPDTVGSRPRLHNHAAAWLGRRRNVLKLEPASGDGAPVLRVAWEKTRGTNRCQYNQP